MASTQTPLFVTANEARLQFSDLINRAIYVNQPTIITRQRKPAVVLIAYDEWLALGGGKHMVPETAPQGNETDTDLAEQP